MTAFSHGARLPLGIAESARGGGEILALRELIVREGGGDYCLLLKGNQGDMLADVRAFVEDQETDYRDE